MVKVAPQTSENRLRQNLCSATQRLVKLGLNRGASGNISQRLSQNEILITPSAITSEKITPSHIVKINLDGEMIENINLPKEKNLKLIPSSEWQIHCDIYRARVEINAVVHTHSTYATILASLGKELPALNYMVAVAGGRNVRCAKYAIFGSKKLSQNALIALRERNVCLLANHGLISIHSSLEKAIYLADEIEKLCEQYVIASQAQKIGKLKILNHQQMDEVLEKFKSYGVNKL